MNIHSRFGRFTLVLGAVAVLAGCMSLPPAFTPIPVHEVRASSGAHERLVVVLPGRGDDLATLERFGIAQEIQRALPETDVLLVEATIRYYMEGRLVARLHDEIIKPARARGYREVWLAGASMGGLGVLMYEHDHPNSADGLLLMAPYMGPRSLLKEIRDAGGLAKWKPGPRPAQLDQDNVTREEWRVVQSWLQDRKRAEDVWLICGDEDRLRDAADLVATALPSDRSMRPSGGHRWSVWSPAAADALTRAVKSRKNEQTKISPPPAEERKLLLTF